MSTGAENSVADLAKDIDAVGWTALGVAWTRARESLRADRWFNDPLAGTVIRVVEPISPNPVPLDIEHADRDLRELPMFRTAAASIDADPDHLWPGGLADEPAGWLTGEGWRATAHDPAELAVEYGRPTPLILDAAQGGGPFATLVDAGRATS